MNKETNETDIIGLDFCKINSRDSPISGCICLIGQHIHLISKYLTSDNRFDPLSRTKYNLISNFKVFQGIPLFQAVAVS